MVKRLSIFILFVVALSFTRAQSINSSFVDILQNIKSFSSRYPQEKVYLHMDNRCYYIGDTIWFKAYVMNASTLHPTQTSGVLYVELLNESGIEMEHLKLRLVNGMCYGNFTLKGKYRTGYYEIRAYTRNMLNWGDTEREEEDLEYTLMDADECEEQNKKYMHNYK